MDAIELADDDPTPVDDEEACRARWASSVDDLLRKAAVLLAEEHGIEVRLME